MDTMSCTVRETYEKVETAISLIMTSTFTGAVNKQKKYNFRPSHHLFFSFLIRFCEQAETVKL